MRKCVPRAGTLETPLLFQSVQIVMGYDRRNGLGNGALPLEQTAGVPRANLRVLRALAPVTPGSADWSGK